MNPPPWSDEYIGIPFKDTPEASRNGLNCYGLIRLVYRERLSIELDDFSDEYYGIGVDENSRVTISEAFKRNLTTWYKIIVIPEAYDIVTFRYGRETSHIGLALDGENFLHIREDSNSTHDKLTNHIWGRMIDGTYRHKSRI